MEDHITPKEVKKDFKIKKKKNKKLKKMLTDSKLLRTKKSDQNLSGEKTYPS